MLAGLGLAVTQDIGWRGVKHAVRWLVLLLRSIPELVLLFGIYFGIGEIGVNVPPLIAAIVALGVAQAGFNSEYFRAGLATIPHSQREAGLSLGLSKFGILRHVVIPQAVPYMYPPMLNAFVGLLKAATLASAIGAQDILWQGENVMNMTGVIVPVVAAIVIAYVVITVPLTRAVGLLERRTRRAH